MCHKISEKLGYKIDAIKQRRFVLTSSRVVSSVSNCISMENIEYK